MTVTTRTTRALVLSETGRERPYVGSRPLEVVELNLADPGPGELLVKVTAAGLCHSDLSVVDGSRPRPVPMAIGHEAAGIVEMVGAGVTDVVVGDHVVLVFVPSCGSCAECSSGVPALCRRGAASNTAGELLRGGSRLSTLDGTPVRHHLGVSAFAERVVVDRGSAVVVDPTVPPEVAALFGCAMLTGFGAVQRTANIRSGESVAVLGLGGVGLAALLGAVVAGAHPVCVVDPVQEKRALALTLGASHAFTPDEAVDGIREVTGGGVAVAVECVGSAAVLRTAWDVTGRGGRTVTVGLPAPSATLTIPAVQLVAEARTLVGSYLGSCAPQRDIPLMIRLWQAGRLPVEALLDRAGPLEEANEALDDLASGHARRRLLVP